MSKKKLLLIGLIVILLIAIPATIYILQQRQQSKSQATASTTLAFSPVTAQKQVDDTIPFDININPGSNLVSFVSLDITYDPTKLAPASSNALVVNNAALPIVLQGPVYASGRIRINLSTGNDPTAAIKAPVKVATLTMKAIAGTGSTPTSLAFGGSTQVLSIAGPASGSNDSASENVLSTSTPAQITISGAGSEVSPTVAPTDTPVPTGVQPTTPVATPTVPAPTTTVTVTVTQPPGSQGTGTTVTPSPSPTATPTNTPAPTSAAATSTPSPTSTSGSTNGTAASVSSTPTIEATGPGLTFVSYGIILAIITFIGAILFFAF